MTPQKFVKSKYPNAKDMYREDAGHVIVYFDKEAMKEFRLSYGRSSANAWKNAKKNILSPGN